MRTWNGFISLSIVRRGSGGLGGAGRRGRLRQADDGRMRRRRIVEDALEGAVLRLILLMLNMMMLGGDSSVFLFLAHFVRLPETRAVRKILGSLEIELGQMGFWLRQRSLGVLTCKVAMGTRHNFRHLVQSNHCLTRGVAGIRSWTV